ncbi:hypothetical protein CEP54_014353 [Fusarium duplospermum]|uniref:Uncharacterized protein n=1 Tax=Fusarium duplospermum TaxID=1325734 RepID=A0A428NWS7_9HYPO|nr:hypothetical protein CEP54_014353 [Fusarium duplospermum]
MLRPKFGPGAVSMLLLAIYSTALSGVWFVVSIIQPRWGFKISTTYGLSPSNAATLTALLGKTIEIASITVFISCIGQALTRRAAAEKSTGITLADITIRNWIIQPGFIFTHHQTLAIAGRTILGALALLSLVVTILYTTASQALVSPKLKYGQWESRELTAPVHSYYGNHVDAGARCTRKRKPDPIKNPNYPGDKAIYKDMALLCLGHELSYKSTRDLLAFKGLGSDAAIRHTEKGGTTPGTAGHTLLHDKAIMEATRVDTEFRDVAALYERWGRVVDNVTVSIPHPGVWSASRFPGNKILQPEDLSNVGGFYMKAAVVSPTLNILCVNMDEDEIAPLVYAGFPHSEKDGFERWAAKEVTKWDNSTVVDDMFRWGSKYGRRRPIFESLPKFGRIEYHRPNSSSDGTDDAGYLVSNRGEPSAEYALCQMRSWLSTECSTHLDVSGVGQPIMRTHCGDEGDAYRYDPSIYNSSDDTQAPELWPFMLETWRRGVTLERPPQDKLFGIPYIITLGVLLSPELNPLRPSMSELLSVLLLPTLSLAAVDTQLRHTWDHGLGKDFDIFDETTFAHDFNTTETFRAWVRSQEYTSGHTENWQGLFYLVLGLTFALNLLCLANLFRWLGLIDDITEPQNHFSLAMSSPRSSRMDASYPDGPEKQHWESSWRVSQSSVGNGYQFDDCKKDL